VDVVVEYLTCCTCLTGYTRNDYHDRLGHRLGAGALQSDLNAAEQQQQQLVAYRRRRKHEQAVARDRLVEERGQLEQVLHEVIDRLDLRRLKDCSPQQRRVAHGLADLLRELLGGVTAAMSHDALRAVPERGRDPLSRAGELLRQINEVRDARRVTHARLAPALRIRRPELEPARKAAQLLALMLPGAAGEALDVLDGQARQLEIAAPVSEEQRRRDHARLALKQVRDAERNNPGWTP
jgi:hypothetical protein